MSTNEAELAITWVLVGALFLGLPMGALLIMLVDWNFDRSRKR